MDPISLPLSNTSWPRRKINTLICEFLSVEDQNDLNDLKDLNDQKNLKDLNDPNDLNDLKCNDYMVEKFGLKQKFKSTLF